MTEIKRPKRPRAVPVRPGFEPDEDVPAAKPKPPARKRSPRKPPAAIKAAAPAARRRSTAARSKAVSPPKVTAPRARRVPTKRDDVEFAYEDESPRRLDRSAMYDPVRANGEIHLAIDDEAWWTMPQVCAKTGEPATKTITHVPSGAPKWAYLTFLLGVLPGILVLRSFPSPRLKIPFADRVRRGRSGLIVVASLAFSIGIVVLIGGLAEANGVALVGAAMIGGGIFAAMRSRLGVKVKVVGREVVISGTHQDFRTALSMQPSPDELRAAFENTSGQGKTAVVPAQVKRWNWGAFFFGGIWAIGNTVWIGLIGFVPLLNIVVGIKGNEWAWRKKRWPSVEEFLTTQRHWAGASAALLAGTVILSLIYSVAGYEAPPTTPSGAASDAVTLEEYAIGRGGVRAGEPYGFSATFPGMPLHDDATENVRGDDVPIDVLTYDAVSDQAFSVAAIRYPAGIDISNPSGMLRGAAYGSAGAIPGGKVTRFSETKTGGDPAAGVLIAGSNGVYARQRYILHGHTLFQLQIVSTTPNPPGFGRFVASFRVV